MPARTTARKVDLPPVRKRGAKYDWPAIAEHLRKSEGEWHRVDEAASINLVHTIHRGRIAALRPTTEWTYEAQSRNNNREARTAEVFVRAVRNNA